MKEMWDKIMRERKEICARAEDLIAYLYSEASETEARDFEKHIERCAPCRTELAAFGDVREAVGEWREQALGSIASPAFENKDVTAFASAQEIYKPKRSALAAIREFFTLSPLWMRAATAAIALIFCALAFIAIAHFKEQPKVVVINEPNKANPVQENRNATVASKDEQPNTPAIKEPTVPQQKVFVANNDKAQTTRQVKNGTISHQQLAGTRKPALRSNLNASEELVENDYLPFTAPSHEEKLPSLADLADEPNQ